MWYRFYELDAENQLRKVTVLDLDSDAEALDAAEAMAGPRDVDIWQASRRVGGIEGRCTQAETGQAESLQAAVA